MDNQWNIGIPNKSTTYMLPMLGSSSLEFFGIAEENYVNCFIANKEIEDFDQNLFVLYRFRQDLVFLKFLENLKLNPYYVDNYEPDDFHIIYIFQVPKERVYDYMMFKESKYSQLSKEYKTHIAKFWNISLDHTVMQTLYKDERKFRELEEILGASIPRGQECSGLINCENNGQMCEVYYPEFKEWSNRTLLINKTFDEENKK